MKLAERLNHYEKLMRLDKPIGILLLLWPTLWALWIAAKGRPNWTIVWVFALGTVLMRSAGCVINDYADRNFDPHVERTRERPLAAAKVSPREALILATGLSLAAFILILRLDKLVIWLSFAALFLAITYPYMKRVISIPQAYLGIAFGFGIPMAFAAYLGTVHWHAWVLLAANILWAVAYDTEYAMVDRNDDVKIGIKTSAITFGPYDILAVMVCYLGMLGLLIWLGLMNKFGLYYYGGLSVTALLMFGQYGLIKDRDRTKCFAAFNANNWIGLAVFCGIALDYYTRLPRLPKWN